MNFFCEYINIDYQALAAIFGTNASVDEEKSYQEPYSAQYSYVDVNKNKLELDISIYEPRSFIWLKRPVKESERSYAKHNQAYFYLFHTWVGETRNVLCDVKNKIITLVQYKDLVVVKIYFEPFIHIKVHTGQKESL
jgi:hypothetical protein